MEGGVAASVTNRRQVPHATWHPYTTSYPMRWLGYTIGAPRHQLVLAHPLRLSALPLSLISPRARSALSSPVTYHTTIFAAYSVVVTQSFSNQPRPQLRQAPLYLL
jgi:hypothetical protein